MILARYFGTARVGIALRGNLLPLLGSYRVAPTYQTLPRSVLGSPMTRSKLLILFPLALLAVLIIALITARSPSGLEGDLQAASRGAGDESDLPIGSKLGEATALVDIAPSDDAREEILTLAATVAPPAGPARLSIVLRGGGEPYPGCIVRFDPSSGAAVDVLGSDGRIGVTDQNGSVTFRVPPHSTLAVEVIPFGTDAVERWSVATPGPGETRDFPISLPPRSVRTSQLEVIDRDSGQPIEGAELRVVDGGLTGTVFTATTGPSGVLTVPIPTSGRLTVSAAGYIERSALIRGDNAPPTGLLHLMRPSALSGRIPEVLASRGAKVTLEELRASGAFAFKETTLRLADLPPKRSVGDDILDDLTGTSVRFRSGTQRLSAKAYDARVSPDGRWEITGVHVPMAAQALEGGRLTLRYGTRMLVLADDLVLKPGDRKEVPFLADWDAQQSAFEAADD